MRRLVPAFAAVLLLAGCGIGSSSLNPANWFGGSDAQEDSLVPQQALVARDTRPLAEEVTDIAIEAIPGGAILRARARVASTGWWGADIARDDARSGDGVVAFTFRALPPDVQVQPGGAANRRLIAAEYLSDDDLAGVRQIQVIARTNARALRR